MATMNLELQLKLQDRMSAGMKAALKAMQDGTKNARREMDGLANAANRIKPTGIERMAKALREVKTLSKSVMAQVNRAVTRINDFELTAAEIAIEKKYDYVICDLAAGLDHGVRRMAAAADLLLVVVTDEPTSLTDAYAVLKLHGRDGDAGRGEIIVNRAKSPPSGTRTYATLAHACKAFLGHTPPLAGIIRNDERVPDSIRRQTPLLTRHPNCLAAQDVEAVVQRLLTCPRQPVQLARASYA